VRSQHLDGINFIHIKKGTLWFVVTTKFNVSPSMVVELLERLATYIRDYCGVLSEESIRKNFTLIYELLDEMIDYGYPQVMATEELKTHIHSEPVVVAAPPSRSVAERLGFGSKTVSASAAARTTLSSTKGGAGKNEIFVDILERLRVLFNAEGYVVTSSVDGCIQMKSFLSGNPPLQLALNPDLVIGAENRSYGGFVLDDATFHECVDLTAFENDRVLGIRPPDGEFVVMNYRMSGEFRAPFRVIPRIEEVSPYKLEFTLKLRADIPPKNYGTSVIVKFAVPRAATSVVPSVLISEDATSSALKASASSAAGKGVPPERTQVAEFDSKAKEVVWSIRKFQGGTDVTLRTTITLPTATAAAARREVGPIGVDFEIPMFNVSGMQVRYLRILEASKSYKPQRWVRYVTQAASYVSRC
jgi:AP-4 complex subunit mu-1